MTEGLDTLHRKITGPLDLSPAQDGNLSDLEAVKAILAASGISPEASSSASGSLLNFAVLLRVRARRHCQTRSYRQFVLRMRMKGMYALMTNSKTASASVFLVLLHAPPAYVYHPLARANS